MRVEPIHLLQHILLGVVAVAGLTGCARTARGTGATSTATAPAPSAAAVPVLMFHEITTAKPPGPEVIAPDRFAAEMKYLADNGYTTLSIPELIAYLHGNPVPERSIVLTFDDGWKSVEQAVPLLDQYRFKATFFIITGAADGNFGSDYLSWAQVESLARDPLFQIGSHSVTHPWASDNNFITCAQGTTPGKSIADVASELSESKRILETHLHQPVRYFAWPCGWTTPQMTAEGQKAGYEAQFTTYQKSNVPGVSPSQIRRFSVDGAWDLETFARFMDGALHPPTR